MHQREISIKFNFCFDHRQPCWSQPELTTAVAWSMSWNCSFRHPSFARKLASCRRSDCRAVPYL